VKSDFVATSRTNCGAAALIRLYAETLELGRLTSKEKISGVFSNHPGGERTADGAGFNNILDFSRIEAGRRNTSFRKLTWGNWFIRPGIYRVPDPAKRFWHSRRNFARHFPPVKVDREAIARSLLNLVNKH